MASEFDQLPLAQIKTPKTLQCRYPSLRKDIKLFDIEPSNIKGSDEIKLESYQFLGSKINYDDKCRLYMSPPPKNNFTNKNNVHEPKVDMVSQEDDSITEYEVPLNVIDLTDDGDEDLNVLYCTNRQTPTSTNVSNTEICSSNLRTNDKVADKPEEMGCLEDIKIWVEYANKMESLIAKLIGNKTKTIQTDILTDLETEIKRIKSKMLDVAESMTQNNIHKNPILQDQMLKRYGEKPFSCGVCSKTFRQKINLLTHSKVHTLEKARAHICHVCNKAFQREITLSNHLRVHSRKENPKFHFHHTNPPYSCAFCQKQYVNKPSLKYHLHKCSKNHHVSAVRKLEQGGDMSNLRWW